MILFLSSIMSTKKLLEKYTWMNSFQKRLFGKRLYIKHNKLSNGQLERDLANLYNLVIDDYYSK